MATAPTSLNLTMPAKVRERVETNAAQLRLRGARRHVLAAVLKLLCGWSRITDDRVGLPQIVELIAAAAQLKPAATPAGKNTSPDPTATNAINQATRLTCRSSGLSVRALSS